MRTLALATLALACLGSAAFAVPAAGQRTEFEVLRNGQPFGRHVVTVTRNGDNLVARTEVALRVAAGPVTLFRYEHECVETWRESVLDGLECETFKGGRRLQVRAASRDGVLHVAGPAGSAALPGELRPTSWWLMPPSGAEAMLDTETGSRMPLRITRMGREAIAVSGRRILAERVRVQGALTVDLWYDADGRWVGCAFDAHGQRIEYRLAA